MVKLKAMQFLPNPKWFNSRYSKLDIDKKTPWFFGLNIKSTDRSRIMPVLKKTGRK